MTFSVIHLGPGLAIAAKQSATTGVDHDTDTLVHSI